MVHTVKRLKIADQILEQLKQKIRDGEFPEGSKLPSENKLAEMFGVSRAPIREVISVLVASGLVESIQGGGNFVKKMPTEDLLDTVAFEMITDEEIYNLLELRTVIETEAAAFAAERHTEEDIEKIYEAFQQVSDTINDDSIVGDQADYDFHMSIVKAAKNSFLTQSVENVRELYQKALTYSLRKNVGRREKREQVHQEHQNIYKAIKRRNKEAAAFYMKEHLTNARLKLGDPRVNK
ncbi:FadR/GntR family transcriptional regulator [Neobacillus niacini]|uniref:FadR/GntR family transcriptional regulator n=1 Tax=Neobacillus niacini TaxID=86668 RepID=UPI0021CB4C45|nr:FadR/GntR family transcriptional regulator [Neobacillus niacini]MCM3767752.1 FadR family transcriptional regulator [Neobacillus niacini]